MCEDRENAGDVYSILGMRRRRRNDAQERQPRISRMLGGGMFESCQVTDIEDWVNDDEVVCVARDLRRIPADGYPVHSESFRGAVGDGVQVILMLTERRM